MKKVYPLPSTVSAISVPVWWKRPLPLLIASASARIRRAESLGTQGQALRGLPEFADPASLEAAQGRPDVIALCGPSRSIPDTAEAFLKQGYNCVDSFDIHTEIPATVARLDAAARAGNSVSITAAGWDPGTDSVLRALFEAMVPPRHHLHQLRPWPFHGPFRGRPRHQGRGRCRVHHHPRGGGRHSRLVYVVLEEGENLADVTARIKADDYFAHDPLDVRQCRDREELAFVADQSHGVLMERTGASGMSDNRILKFDMRINNPRPDRPGAGLLRPRHDPHAGRLPYAHRSAAHRPAAR